MLLPNARALQPCKTAIFPTRLQTPASPIKLPPLNINPVLPNRTPQILHRQHRPSRLPPSPAPTSIPRPLHPQHMLPALPLVVFAPAPAFAPPASLRPARPALEPGYRGRGARRAGRLARARRRRPHPRILVCVRCYVGDELLGREREEPGEGEGGRCGGEPGEQEVVLGYCVGDLHVVLVR